jgi:hypothetical protein
MPYLDLVAEVSDLKSANIRLQEQNQRLEARFEARFNSLESQFFSQNHPLPTVSPSFLPQVAVPSTSALPIPHSHSLDLPPNRTSPIPSISALPIPLSRSTGLSSNPSSPVPSTSTLLIPQSHSSDLSSIPTSPIPSTSALHTSRSHSPDLPTLIRIPDILPLSPSSPYFPPPPLLELVVPFPNSQTSVPQNPSSPDSQSTVDYDFDLPSPDKQSTEHLNPPSPLLSNENPSIPFVPITPIPGSSASVISDPSSHTFYCVPCSIHFSKNSNLQRHLQKHHPSPCVPSTASAKPFLCFVCNKRLSRNYTLLRHLRDLHGL